MNGIVVEAASNPCMVTRVGRLCRKIASIALVGSLDNDLLKATYETKNTDCSCHLSRHH